MKKANKKRSVALMPSLLAGLSVALVGIIASLLLISTAPSSVASGIAINIFQLTVGLDGTLIGFLGIISVFILRELSKKNRLIIFLYVYFTLLVFVGSILFSLSGLMRVGSSPVSSRLFVVPIGLMISGISALIYFTIFQEYVLHPTSR